MLLVVRCAGNAGNNAEDGAETVVHAVNCISDPAAAAAMPAFPFQDGIERGARSRRSGWRHGVEDAGVRFFFERGFVEKFQGVGIVCQGAFTLAR